MKLRTRMMSVAAVGALALAGAACSGADSGTAPGQELPADTGLPEDGDMGTGTGSLDDGTGTDTLDEGTGTTGTSDY